KVVAFGSEFDSERLRQAARLVTLEVNHDSRLTKIHLQFSTRKVKRVTLWIPRQRNPPSAVQHEYISGRSEPAAGAVYGQLEAGLIAPAQKRRLNEAV